MNADVKKPVKLLGIRNITVSGRIGTGKSTLAVHLAQVLGWNILDGGKIFRKLANQLGIHISEKNKIPDKLDIEFEEKVKQILINENNYVVQSHLAGFVAQDIKGVYKILIVCEDEEGKDKRSVRIDRLVNRDFISAGQAKEEVAKREEEHLEKFKKLYVKDDPNWVYWDEKYYDLVVNTFNLNQKEAVEFTLSHIGFNDKSKVNLVFENLKKDV